jgi:hypothetical protein
LKYGVSNSIVAQCALQVTYSIQLDHTAFSNTSVFDVYITATVHTFVDIETVMNGSIAGTTYVVAGDRKSVVWYIARFPLATATYTTSFTVRVNNDVWANTQGMVCNLAVVADSRPLAAYGYDGRSLGTSSVSLPLVIRVPTFDFANTISYIPTTVGNELAINEATTIQLNVTLVEITSDIRVTLSLPLVLKMVAFEASVVYGSNVVCASEVKNIVDTNADSVRDTVQFLFGTCVNTYDNIENDLDKIYMTVVVAPLDVPANIDGVTPLVSSTLLYGNNALITPSASIVNTLSYVLLEPNLINDPVVSSRLFLSDAGDVVRASLSIHVLAHIS